MVKRKSNKGDLTQLARDLEAVFLAYGLGKPALAIAFTLPPDYKETHWVTNVSREDGIELFQETANKMRIEASGKN